MNPLTEIKKIDYLLLGTTLLLVGMGAIIVAGASSYLSIQRFGAPIAYFYHQLAYGVIPGIILGLIFIFIPLSFLRRFVVFILLGSIILLILVFLPYIGSSSNTGATRWINIGILSFQPSEFVKIGFLLYISAWASSYFEKTKRNLDRKLAYSFIPFLFILVTIGTLLILQPDVSTLGIIALSGLLVYFSAQTPWYHILIFLFLGIIALIVLIPLAPYRLARLMVFLNPNLDTMGIGYQLNQSLITIGSGGLWGIGSIGEYQQLKYLPAAMSDAVFSVFAQGTGFIGSVFLISFFLIFMWRGLTIADRARDPFLKYLSVGITSWILLQAFINIGSMSGILPITGIPLPFISYGGSHLIAELIGVGILLNISRDIS